MADKNLIVVEFKAKGAAELQSVIRTLYVETQRLKKGQQGYEQALKSLNTRNKKVMDNLLGLQHSTRNTGHAFSVARSKLLLMGFAVTLLVNPLKKLFDAMSAAEEGASKANVVFGETIDVVTAWAQDMGQSLGRAESSMIEFASTLQDTFVPLGYSRKYAAALSTSLVELALDVASFNNKLDADVIRDFQSAIVGNHETVRKYGIVISEHTIQQEALRQGLIHNIRELTETEKVTARLGIIQQGTSDASGDLMRTQSSYANQVKIFSEQLKVTMEDLGRVLLPVAKMTLTIASHFSKPRVIYTYAAAVGIMGLAWAKANFWAGTFAATMWHVRKSLYGFASALTTITGGLYGIVLAVGLTVDLLITLGMWLFSGSEELNNYEESLARWEEEAKKAKTASEILANQIIKTTKALKDEADLIDAKIKDLATEFNLHQRIHSITKDREGGINSLTEAERLLLQIIQEKNHQYNIAKKEQTALQKLEKEIYGNRLNQIRQLIDSQQTLLDAENALTKGIEDKITASDKAVEAGLKSNANWQQQNKTISDSVIEINKWERSIASTKTELEGLPKEIRKLSEEQGNLELKRMSWFLSDDEKEEIDAGIVSLKLQIKTLNIRKKVLEGNVTEEESWVESLKDTKEAAEAALILYGNMSDEGLKKLQKALQDAKDELIANDEATDEHLKNIKDWEAAIGKLEKKMHAIKGALYVLNAATDSITVSFDGMFQDISGGFDQYAQTWMDATDKQRENGQAMKDIAWEVAGDIIAAALQAAQAEIAAKMQVARETARLNKQINADNAKTELDNLKSGRKYLRMTVQSQKDAEEKILQAQKDADAEEDKILQVALAKQHKKKQEVAIAGVIMDTASAMIKIWAQVGLLAPAVIGVLVGLAAVQIGLIKSQKPPKAAKGGYIGGKSHAQGGTLIEAEKGEFIMSRDAVEGVGLETMNRINSGASGGAINISFAGNVLSRDFIEDEAIPQIKEALRRGGDIGVG